MSTMPLSRNWGHLGVVNAAQFALMSAAQFAQQQIIVDGGDGVRGASYLSDGAAWQPLGGSGSASNGYLGQVASQSAMTALVASVGAECLRTDLGAGGLRYELTALPASIVGNWQPVQGTLVDGSVATVALVDGKLPRRLLLDVVTGCQITVAVGGVTQPVAVENVTGQPSEIIISDSPAAAQPTTLTIQRTSGSGTTSTWSLES